MTERFNVAGALLVKLFGRPAVEAESFRGRAARVRDIGVLSAMYGRTFFTALTLVAALATALVYGLGGTLAFTGSLSPGDVVALALLLSRLYGPLTALSNVRVDIMSAMVSFDRVFEVLDLPPMIREADDGLKERIGRVAYVWTGVKQLGRKPFGVTIKVDGSTWFKGKASCVLLGNFGELFAEVEAFEDARPDDGMLDLGVVTADSVLEWMRTIGRTVVGASSASPFVQVTKARSARVKFDRKVLYELDGGDRKEVKKLAVEIEPAAVDVCVPAESA